MKTDTALSSSSFAYAFPRSTEYFRARTFRSCFWTQPCFASRTRVGGGLPKYLRCDKRREPGSLRRPTRHQRWAYLSGSAYTRALLTSSIPVLPVHLFQRMPPTSLSSLGTKSSSLRNESSYVLPSLDSLATAFEDICMFIMNLVMLKICVEGLVRGTNAAKAHCVSHLDEKRMLVADRIFS